MSASSTEVDSSEPVSPTVASDLVMAKLSIFVALPFSTVYASKYRLSPSIETAEKTGAVASTIFAARGNAESVSEASLVW